MTTQPYSGTLLSDLHAKVDDFLAIYGTQPDPLDWLIRMRNRLADMMTPGTDEAWLGDLVQAWFALGEIQDAFVEDEIRECWRCHKLRPQHTLGLFCELPVNANDAEAVLSPQWEPRP